MPTPKTICVFVALADNRQGIVPVSPKIGNGDDPDNNLYWGFDDGLKTYFSRRTSCWIRMETRKYPTGNVLERITFRHKMLGHTLIADAYAGLKIHEAITDFCRAAVGENDPSGRRSTLSSLVSYIGHNGLMNFSPPEFPTTPTAARIPAIVLACESDAYFTKLLRDHGANPLLMTRQLMYPGAFILHDALESWFKGESKEQVRLAAARAYAKNQEISVKLASGVFMAP